MTRLRFRRRGFVTGLVAVAALATAGGIAYATIPGPNNVYSACMLKGVGTIRMIDKSLPSTNLTSRCTDRETEISWNQAGQTGSPGPQGIPGPPGPAGSPGADGANAGPAYVATQTSDVVLSTAGQTKIVDRDLAPGAYVFSAKVTATSQAQSLLACYLESIPGLELLDQAQAAFAPLAGTPIPGTTTVSLVGAESFTETTTIFVGCVGYPSGVTAQGVVTAVKVASID